MQVLATPYIKGNNDIIVNEKIAAEIPEGVVVSFANKNVQDNSIVQFTDINKVPYGISGVAHNARQAVIRRGFDCLVQLKAGDNPSIGSYAYVDTSGVVTTSENKYIIGIFKSTVVTGQDSKGNIFNSCAFIDVDMVMNSQNISIAKAIDLKNIDKA